MAGRGGRGAALLERLKQQKEESLRRPGEGQARPTVEQSSTSEGDVSVEKPAAKGEKVVVTPAASTSAFSAPAAKVSTGRGSLLQKALAAKLSAVESTPGQQSPESPDITDPSTSSSGTSPATSQPSSLYAGRGMAIFKRMAESKTSSSPITTSESQQSSSSVSGGPPIQEMERMKIESPKVPAVFRGEAGKQIPLLVNHLPVKIREGRGVFEYAVMFSPDVESRNNRFKLLHAQTEILGITRTFDGSKLFLPFKLPDQITVLMGSHPNDETPIRITIKFISQQKLGDCVQLFNILLRRCMNWMELVQIGRQTFDPKGSVAIPKHKLEMWPGYITAIQEYEGGLMLCAETSHRVLRTQTVLEIMFDALKSRPGQYRDIVAKAIIGSTILTRYNNKTYRIDDILWDQSPLSTFETASGETTYVDYYKKTYNITLRDMNQPLLLNKAKKKAVGEEGTKLLCMIPELCFLTGLSDEMRSDFHIMKDIATHTRLAPAARQFELIKFINNINSCPKAKEVLDNWGVYLEPELTSIPGRVFPEEKITFGQGSAGAGMEADWGRAMTRNQVTKAVNMMQWLVLFTRRDEANMRNFVDQVLNVGPQLGIQVQRPNIKMIADDRNDSFVRALREHLYEGSGLQIVVIICPSPRDDRYNLIKQICCCDNPIPSQVINGRTISKPQMLRSVTQKVVLQMNCKLGGELWSLDIPLSNLMVCGIDSYHDPTRKGKSVLGFVASMNRTLTRWFSSSEFQIQGQELGACLHMCLVKSLQKYHEVNHSLPEKIIIFRDGVSDGQLDHVTHYEIAQLKEAFVAFAGYSPALIVIIVQKRINTRLFSDLGSRGRDINLGNPPPGTVLDNTVTRKYLYDFFLVSQHVRQGTVTPTHYIVIYNTSALKPDHIQRITYKMTHLYYNWPGTVRVPAPCQYAHKLAYLVGQNIKKEPSIELRDRLFFL